MEDSFLIQQVLGGNRNAFRLLVVRYQRPVFRFLGGFGLEQATAEELAQETFLRAYRNLSSFDASKSAFSSWLFTIAKHLAMNEAARSHRRAPHVEFETNSPVSDAPLPPEVFETKELGHRVRSALRKLPDFLRSALVLAYLKELSLQEIAAIECCSLGTVKSRISRGKQQLRALLATMEK